MFPQQPQQQFRKAGADVQIFYGPSSGSPIQTYSWVKPTGVSHIYMLLIGGGGDGDGTNGGGSGSVTVWHGAAQHVPDSLVVQPSPGGRNTHTNVYYRSATAGLVQLLRANTAIGNSGGTAMTANQFTASGFFQSVAGQNAGLTTASATTFLSGGSGSGLTTANYGYTASVSKAGYFMLQPIIVGVGGAGGASVGGVGCGGALTGTGGQGMVLIASW